MFNVNETSFFMALITLIHEPPNSEIHFFSGNDQEVQNKPFLAHQIDISVVFTHVRKFCFTYPYQPVGKIKKQPHVGRTPRRFATSLLCQNCVTMSYLSHCQNSSKFLSVSYLMKTADVIMIFFHHTILLTILDKAS